MNFKLSHYDANIEQDKSFHFTECTFKVEDGMTFTVNTNGQSNYSLKISGQNGKFLSGNSTIVFSLGSGLWIGDNSLIEANGTTFCSNNNYNIGWEGICLFRPGTSIINNCKFNHANHSIYSLENWNNYLNITNNTFCIPYFGILIDNAFNVSISNNHFWIQVDDPCAINGGLQVCIESNSEYENDLAPWYRINIIGNDFHAGNQQFSVVSYGDLLSVYVNGNSFYGGVENMVFFNSCGNISNNLIDSILTFECAFNSIKFLLSKPDFLSNNFSSNYNNFGLYNSSYPNFAPLQIDNQFFWKAGYNRFITLDNHYIIVDPYIFPGYPFTDYGKNHFDRHITGYHFNGYLDDSTKIYRSSGNCWSGGYNNLPTVFFQRSDNSVIDFYYEPSIDCNWSDQIVDRIINDLGNGIYDTILISQSNSIPSPNVDESLYATGVKNQELKNYSSSILNFKNLINFYQDSKFIEKSIFNMYECYVFSDTSHNQSQRNIIFGDFKNYLEDKMQLYDTNSEFINVAFEYYLKCLVKIKNYSLSLDGYHFIVNNSPLAIARLLASLNYLDVERLMQGSGGGEKENTDQKMKPIKDILLKNYSKINKLIKEKENLDLKKSKDKSKTKIEQDKNRQFNKKLENRAIENINISKSLTKEQRRERIRKDLMLLTQRESSKINIDEPKQLPINYSLSQNYPNPFNPLTKINYSIPKQGLVILKIYDILGREIKTLVNETKSPGNYIVEFNGSEFSSGVYFYRIQAGNFSQVKRMMLIK